MLDWTWILLGWEEKGWEKVQKLSYISSSGIDMKTLEEEQFLCF